MEIPIGIDRETFLVFVAAMTACHQGASNISTVTIATATASTLPAAPTACDELIAKNQRVLANATSECVASNDADEGRDRVAEDKKRRQQLQARQDLPLFNYCHEDHGTWSVVLLSAQITAPEGESNSCSASVSYQLVYVSTKNEKSVSKPRTWKAFADEVENTTIKGQLDVDGDGSDELFLENRNWYNGGGNEDSAEVLHAVSGALVPYPVEFHFDGVIDADGDGRFDLVDSTYFTASEPCMGLYQTYRRGPPMLLHSLPNGKFSMSDDIARRWARARCLVHPPKITSPTSEESPALVAACRRLWGESPAEIAKGLPTTDQCGSSEAEVTRELVSPRVPFKPLDIDTPDPLPAKHAN